MLFLRFLSLIWVVETDCELSNMIGKNIIILFASVGVTRTSVLAMRISIYYPTKNLNIVMIIIIADQFQKRRVLLCHY